MKYIFKYTEFLNEVYNNRFKINEESYFKKSKEKDPIRTSAAIEILKDISSSEFEEKDYPFDIIIEYTHLTLEERLDLVLDNYIHKNQDYSFNIKHFSAIEENLNKYFPNLYDKYKDLIIENKIKYFKTDINKKFDNKQERKLFSCDFFIEEYFKKDISLEENELLKFYKETFDSFCNFILKRINEEWGNIHDNINYLYFLNNKLIEFKLSYSNINKSYYNKFKDYFKDIIINKVDQILNKNISNFNRYKKIVITNSYLNNKYNHLINADDFGLI